MIGVRWPDGDSVRAAGQRIQDHVRRTPLITLDAPDVAGGHPVLLKCENQQEIGAFKARGACNAVLALDETTAARGVATHSSGNHATALARAAYLRGIQAHVVMPEGAARPKREAAQSWGARIIECPATMSGRIQALEAVVAETGAHVVHPYEDHHVMSGQGTVALELQEALEPGDTLLVPLGGGGLISGMAGLLAESHPQLSIIGVEPAGADDAQRSFKAGRVIPVQPDTIADGLRATVGETNLAIIQRYIDDIVTVSDEQIRQAMGLIWRETGMRIEPSGAVAVAALISGAYRPRGRSLCVMTGGNVAVEAFDCW